MNDMKRFLAGLTIASLMLTAVPVLAAESPAPTGIAWFTTNLKKGWEYYLQTLRGWIGGVAHRSRTTEDTGSATSCEEQSDCPQGQACLNFCPSGDCDVMPKRCGPGPSEIKILPAWSSCSPAAVCAKGSLCTRTCPKGAECATVMRCVPTASKSPSCGDAISCVSHCRSQGLPPIGFSAFKAYCAEGSCGCAVQEIDPDLKRETCTGTTGADAALLVCASGTSPGCTSEKGTTRLTCLKAPEFGGQCLTDGQCGNVNCPSGTQPFCDTDSLCRCRGRLQQALKCAADADCSAIECPGGQAKVCSSGACACGSTTMIEQDVVCSTAADCPGSCASGFQHACVASKCACQRTVESGPVTCSTLADCGGVSCPAGYEKTCHNAICACARQVQQ